MRKLMPIIILWTELILMLESFKFVSLNLKQWLDNVYLRTLPLVFQSLLIPRADWQNPACKLTTKQTKTTKLSSCPIHLLSYIHMYAYYRRLQGLST